MAKEAKQSIAQLVKQRAESGVGVVMMTRTPKSSNVASIGYDKPTRTLYVEFLKGYRPRVGRQQKKKLKLSEVVIYKYFNVGYNIYQQMHHAPSKGKYHWRHVRGKFRYMRLGRKGWRGPVGGHRARAHKPAGFQNR